jgi:hypothetical protein
MELMKLLGAASVAIILLPLRSGVLMSFRFLTLLLCVVFISICAAFFAHLVSNRNHPHYRKTYFPLALIAMSGILSALMDFLTIAYKIVLSEPFRIDGIVGTLWLIFGLWGATRLADTRKQEVIYAPHDSNGGLSPPG